jgi:hypothetical protein
MLLILKEKYFVITGYQHTMEWPTPKHINRVIIIKKWLKKIHKRGILN